MPDLYDIETRLVNAIVSLPPMDDFNTRTTLLTGLHYPLTRVEGNKRSDVLNMVNGLAELDSTQFSAGEHPLILLAQNARGYISEGAVADDLDKIISDLQAYYPRPRRRIQTSHDGARVNWAPVGIGTAALVLATLVLVVYLLVIVPGGNKQGSSRATFTATTLAGVITGASPTATRAEAPSNTATQTQAAPTLAAQAPSDTATQVPPTPVPSTPVPPTATPTASFSFSVGNGDPTNDSWGGCQRAYEIPNSYDPDHHPKDVASWYSTARSQNKLDKISRVPLPETVTGAKSHFQDEIRITSGASNTGAVDMPHNFDDGPNILAEEFPSFARESAKALQVDNCSGNHDEGITFEPVSFMPGWVGVTTLLRTPEDSFFRWQPGRSDLATIDFVCTQVEQASSVYRPTLKLTYTYQGGKGLLTRVGPLLLCPNKITLYKLTQGGDDLQLPPQVYTWNGSDYVP